MIKRIHDERELPNLFRRHLFNHEGVRKLSPQKKDLLKRNYTSLGFYPSSQKKRLSPLLTRPKTEISITPPLKTKKESSKTEIFKITHKKDKS